MYRPSPRVPACASLVTLASGFAAFLFILLGAISSFGQTPQPNARVFTLEEAVNYALANYPAVRAALSQVNAAQAGVGVARTAYLPQANSLWQTNRGTRNNIYGQLLPQSVIPSLSGPVLPSTSGANVWGSAAGVLASWEPFDFGLRGASVDIARAGEATAQAQAGITRLEVALAAANAYLALLAAQQITEIARADVERREVFAKSVGVLVQNQLRPGVDASQAEADLAQAHIRLIQAQTAEKSGRLALATLLGLGAMEIEIVPGPLLKDPPPALPSTQDLANNPFALAQMARVGETQARERALSKSYFPKFILQSALSGRGSGAETDGQTLGGTTGLDLQRMNWAAGVQVTFPILDTPGGSGSCGRGRRGAVRGRRPDRGRSGGGRLHRPDVPGPAVAAPVGRALTGRLRPVRGRPRARGRARPVPSPVPARAADTRAHPPPDRSRRPPVSGSGGQRPDARGQR